MIPLFRFEPHQAADELRMDAHRDPSPRDFFHHRQRKFAGRAQNFYADRLDELVRELDEHVRFVGLSYRNAIAIMLAKIFYFARLDAIAADENDWVGHSLNLGLDELLDVARASLHHARNPTC